jgi:hypothetical protein
MLLRLLPIFWLLASAGVSAVTLNVVVESLDENAQSCGLSSDALTLRARQALRAGRVDVASSAIGYLYIRVTTQFTSNGCTADVSVAIKQPAMLAANAQFRSADGTRGGFVMAEVCKEGNLLSGPRSTFSNQIEGEVEQEAKNCLGSLDYK